MMTLTPILETGQLVLGTDPQVLIEVKAQLEDQIAQHQRLLARVEQLLIGSTHPYGLDQMTPLSG